MKHISVCHNSGLKGEDVTSSATALLSYGQQELSCSLRGFAKEENFPCSRNKEEVFWAYLRTTTTKKSKPDDAAGASDMKLLQRVSRSDTSGRWELRHSH